MKKTKKLFLYSCLLIAIAFIGYQMIAPIMGWVNIRSCQSIFRSGQRYTTCISYAGSMDNPVLKQIYVNNVLTETYWWDGENWVEDQPEPDDPEPDNPPVPTLGPEDFDFGIETGSGRRLTEPSPNSFQFYIKTDQSGSKYDTYWYMFKIKQDCKNVNIQFTVRDCEFDHDPVYSYDLQTWTKIPATYTSWQDRLTFSITPSQNHIYIAESIPYTYTHLQTYINSIRSSPHVTSEVIGTSSNGRNIYGLTITDSSSNLPKNKVGIVAGQHAGEHTSMWLMEGLINEVKSDYDILTQNIFYIIPMINPDGVFAGKSRLDTNNVDLNREWKDSNPEQEVAVARNWLTAKSLDLVIDSHATPGLGYDMMLLPEYEGGSLYQESLKLQAKISKYTSIDQQRSVDTGELGKLQLASIDNWGILSVVLEPWNEGKTISQMKSEGRGVADAVHEYFQENIPEEERYIFFHTTTRQVETVQDYSVYSFSTSEQSTISSLDIDETTLIDDYMIWRVE